MKAEKVRIGIAVVMVLAAVIIIVVENVHHKNKATTSSNTQAQSSTLPTINNDAVITKSNSSLGKYLANLSSQTLYTYSADKKNISNCTSECLISWPPYIDNGSITNLPTNIGVIKRSDTNQEQYTFKGSPLYFYTGDAKPGQTNGSGVAGFMVARP